MSRVHAAAEAPPGARQLARGITATWWYTVSGVVVFEALLLVTWTSLTVRTDSAATTLLVAVGGAVWLLSTLPLLAAYRHQGDADSTHSRVSVVAALCVALAYGALAGVMVGSWLLALTPIAQSLMLLAWPVGMRYRVLGVATIALLCLVLADSARGASLADREWWAVVVYTVLVPVMTVSSLWWWDVLVVLDRARASEAHLAATQERLRVATDVHDLQGHHLQVIALQLELAERLHTSEPDTALAELQAARTSVADARQGTRDLATRFRSVPLSDELANARDLLSAAGLAVDTDIASDADLAPASDLGPVIRETTTNVLRHGGGQRASLTLTRGPRDWRYEITNDAPSAGGGFDGSGLDGIRRRIGEAGGTVHVHRGEVFAVTVTVPDAHRDTR